MLHVMVQLELYVGERGRLSTVLEWFGNNSPTVILFACSFVHQAESMALFDFTGNQITRFSKLNDREPSSGDWLRWVVKAT
jgi:hypothetical protein